jgi:ABC-2 type transport system ATP-binding protein
MLEVDGVSYRYPGAEHPALDCLSLRLQPGECLGLLGPNGAGKTTLLSLLCRMRAPGSGEIRLALAGPPGIVPQQLAFYPALSVQENLQFFADLHRLRGADRRERMAWAVERCALGEHLQRRADSLSGGEQRRLNFAIGVLQPAGLYLFDEATVGVDARSRQLLLEAVQALAAAGHAVIYTSHYLDEVERVAQRILLLDRGQVRLDLDLRELLGERHGLLLKWPGQMPAALEALLASLQLPYRQHVDGWYIEQLSGAQLEQISAFIASQPELPTLLRFGRPSLEQLYLHLSGGSL